MKGTRSKQSTLIQELDSDDELPDAYKDATILPTYLIENRFDEIKFAWIQNFSEKYTDTQLKQRDATNSNQNKDYEKLHMKGVLKHQDLYCLKSVEPFTCTSTLIWFVNFLLHKDLQSHYNYLKSCLVNDLASSNPILRNNLRNEYDQGDRVEIVIKF